MSIFARVQKNRTLAPPKGIIYGEPKIGKTTFGASAPGALIIDCENGAGSVDCSPTPYLGSWPEIHEWLAAIEKEQHDYSVLVIDSLDWMLRRIEENVSGATSDNALDKVLGKSHGGYGHGKQVMRNYIYRLLLPTLNRIIERGIPVILLAHARQSKIIDIDGIEITKTAPDIPDDYLSVFVEWSDFICLARKGADGNRVLVTADAERAVTGNRYGMPSIIPLDWASFTAAIGSGKK